MGWQDRLAGLSDQPRCGTREAARRGNARSGGSAARRRDRSAVGREHGRAPGLACLAKWPTGASTTKRITPFFVASARRCDRRTRSSRQERRYSHHSGRRKSPKRKRNACGEHGLLARDSSMPEMVRQLRHVRQRLPFERRAADYRSAALAPHLRRASSPRDRRFPSAAAGATSRCARRSPGNGPRPRRATLPRSVLRRFAEFPEQRLRRHLRVAALPQPAIEALGLRANQRIALGMRDDRPKPGELQFVQRLVERRRNRIVREFDEQVVLLVQREARRRPAGCLAGFQSSGGSRTRWRKRAALRIRPEVHSGAGLSIRERKASWARVRSADNVRDAVLDGHFGHRARNFHRLRPVVKIRKYVAMNVNHQQCRIAQRGKDDNARAPRR